MSLTITVRKNTETAGGANQTLPDTGDNGNQEIDTKAEAEAALAFVTSDDLVAVLGGKSYSRQELIGIRDRNAAGGETGKQGEGVSHGFVIQGSYSGGTGEKGHSGAGMRVGYVAGIPLAGDGESNQLHLDITAAFTSGNRKADFTTPGGEKVVSAYTPVGALLGAAFRFVPNFAGHRLGIGGGVNFGVGHFFTDDSKTVSLPAKCIPGDFGRGECEPSAGPRSGDSGKSGLMNFDRGSANGASGAYFYTGFPFTVSIDVVQAAWGTLRPMVTFEPGLNFLMPSEGHGFSHVTLTGLLGIGGHFGGAATYTSQPAAAVAPSAAAPTAPPVDGDGDGVPDSEDKCPDIKGTKENAGCLAYDAKVLDVNASVKSGGKVSVQVEVSGKSEVSVQFKDGAGKLYNAGASVIVEKGTTISDFNVPASLPAGKYKLVVTMKDAQSKVEKVAERDIAIVERVDWTVFGSFAPGQAPTAQDVKVVGLTKLEGVSYTIVAYDKDNKEVGKVSVADKPGTIEDKRGSRIVFQAPDLNGKPVGWQKDITYKVTLLNKEGNVLDVKSFDAAPLPPPAKGGGGKRPRL